MLDFLTVPDKPKPKSTPKARVKPGPKPSPQGRRDSLIAIKCWRAYKVWLNKFAKAKRLPPSVLFDLAMSKLAEAEGFEPPPER